MPVHINASKDIIVAAGVIRPSWGTREVNDPITWSFINDSEHDFEFFTGVSGSGSGLLVEYPTVSEVISLVACPDELFSQSGLMCGASVGLSSSSILLSAPYSSLVSITGTGTGWNNGSYVWASGVTTANNLPGNSDNDGFATSFIYAGTNNRIIRPMVSGIGARQQKFQLVDPSTNTVITDAPTSDDKILINAPLVPSAFNANLFSSHGVQKKIFNATSDGANSTGNIWIIGVFKR